MTNMIMRLGVGAPGYNALRRETKREVAALQRQRQQQQAKAKSKTSRGRFIDNVQHQNKKDSRVGAEKQSIYSGVLQAAVDTPPDSKFARVQFDQPLLQSPLPPRSLAVYETTASDQALLDQFLREAMNAALARVLLWSGDRVARRGRLQAALHEHGLKSKVCTNPACADRFRTFYKKSKRLCDVSVCCCWRTCISTLALTLLWSGVQTEGAQDQIARGIRCRPAGCTPVVVHRQQRGRAVEDAMLRSAFFFLCCRFAVLSFHCFCRPRRQAVGLHSRDRDCPRRPEAVRRDAVGPHPRDPNPADYGKNARRHYQGGAARRASVAAVVWGRAHTAPNARAGLGGCQGQAAVGARAPS